MVLLKAGFDLFEVNKFLFFIGYASFTHDVLDWNEEIYLNLLDN